MPATADARAGRAAFTHPGFVLFQIARFLIVAAVEMQAVAVGWQVYEITKRPLDLGYVGLAQFLPAILLFPISGHASDRFERRNVLSACYAGYAVCFALLLALAAARRAVDHIDLCGVGADRSGAVVQQHCQPLDPAAVGSRGTLPECGCVERQHLSGGNDSGAVVRRHRVRGV